MSKLPLWGKIAAVILGIVVIITSLAYVPTGKLVYEPVDPINLEGRILIGGKRPSPLQGSLSLVGVSEKPIGLLRMLYLSVSDNDAEFVSQAEDDDQRAKLDRKAMADTKELSAAIAFDLAGRSVQWSGQGATVSSVEPGGPASGQLLSGDVIESINGRSVNNSVAANQILRRLTPSSRVTMLIRRAGTGKTVALTTAEPVPGDELNRSRIGITMDTLALRITLPEKVQINNGNVVGPSAGLAFALYIYDAVSDKDLLKGRRIVVSGSLSLDGQVHPVGRIKQKAIAAQRSGSDLLVVPRNNRAEAESAIRESCDSSVRCVKVVGVGSVKEAINLLEDVEQLEAALSR